MKHFLLFLNLFPLLSFATTPYELEQVFQNEFKASSHEVAQFLLFKKYTPKGKHSFQKWDFKELEELEKDSLKKELPKRIIEKAQSYTQLLKIKLKEKNARATCHGIPISPTHILTAAHCLENTKGKSITTVSTGDNRTSRNFYRDPFHIMIYGSSKKNYSTPIIFTDIAVIELDTPTKNYFPFSKKTIKLNSNDKQCFMTDIRDNSFAVKVNEIGNLRLKDQPDFSNTHYIYDTNIQKSFYAGKPGYSGGPIWCYDPKTDSLFLNGILNNGSELSTDDNPTFKALDDVITLVHGSTNFNDYSYGFIESILKNSESDETYITAPIREYYEYILDLNL